MSDFTVDVYYEDAQNTFISDCVDTLTVWDVNHGDVLAVHVEGSFLPLTPVMYLFAEEFTFEYTSRRTIITEGSAYVPGDSWPSPPQAAGGFGATVDCNLTSNNVSFTWDAMEIPARIEIRDSYSTEIVAVPNPENAFCNNCVTIPRDGGSGMYYMIAYTGTEPNIMAGPTSTDATVSCPELGSISGTVWNDIDRDRRRDRGESPIANVSVILTGAGADNTLDTEDDLVFAPQTTGSTGDFTFVELGYGLFRIEVDDASSALSGKSLTTNNNPLELILNANEDYIGAAFGFGS